MIDYIIPIIVGIALGLAIGYVIAKYLEKTKATKILRKYKKRSYFTFKRS